MLPSHHSPKVGASHMPLWDVIKTPGSEKAMWHQLVLQLPWARRPYKTPQTAQVVPCTRPHLCTEGKKLRRCIGGPAPRQKYAHDVTAVTAARSTASASRGDTSLRPLEYLSPSHRSVNKLPLLLRSGDVPVEFDSGPRFPRPTPTRRRPPLLREFPRKQLLRARHTP